MGKFWDGVTAVVRQGAKDLHNNIVPAFPTYAHGVDEPGTPLNPAPAAEPPTGQPVVRQAEKEQDKGIEL